MNKNINIVLVIFLFLDVMYVTKAQSYYPEVNGYYVSQNTQYNTAVTTDSSKFLLNIRHKAFSNTNIYWSGLDANWRFSNSRIRQWLGVWVNNSQQGPYITSPSFYFKYKISLPLSETYSLAIGTQIGNNSFLISIPGQGFNYSLLDGQVGLFLNHPKWNMGASSDHIFNNKQLNVYFKRYYNFHLNYISNISAFWQIDNGFLIRYFSDYTPDVRVGSRLKFKDAFRVGIFANRFNSCSLIAEPIFKIGNTDFQISLGYNFQYLSSVSYLPNSFELGIKILK
ncbi:MAG: hypothetical protein U0V72_09910 [Cytophagales bacterium]